MTKKLDQGSLPELDVRARELLAAVIREYIATAQPVASAQLVRRYRLEVSPATVRNELASLEELGLLTHPHTSAGRVPTDLGYRYFIESLMPRRDGFSVLRELRADGRIAELPVVVVTAIFGLSERLYATELGAADYVTKPFELDDLVNRVKVLLSPTRA